MCRPSFRTRELTISTLHLPRFSTPPKPARKPPRERLSCQTSQSQDMVSEESSTENQFKEAEVQTDICGVACTSASETEILKKEVTSLKYKYQKHKFCLSNISNDDLDTEQRLIPFPSFLFPYFFEQWSSLHLFSFTKCFFPYYYFGCH